MNKKYDITEALMDLVVAQGKMPSVIIISHSAIEEIQKIRAENENLKIAHARYECVRRLSPRSFDELWKANVMQNEGTFDELVDKLIKGEK